MTDVAKPNICGAPWTPEQVMALNKYQRAGWMHPFTCGICRERLGTRDAEGNWVSDRELVATIKGWICPTCDYTQNWAHDFMFNPPPPAMADWLEMIK